MGAKIHFFYDFSKKNTKRIVAGTVRRRCARKQKNI